MKKLRAAAIVIILTTFTITLAGCWNYKEINFVTMVAGMAIDKTADGKFLVTFETVEPSGGKEGKTTPGIIQSEGTTLFDAIRNAVKISGKKLYFSHTKVVLVSQELAQAGISPVVDWVTRDAEPRLELYMVVSRKKTANEIINQEEPSTTIKSYDIYSILKTQSSVAKSNDVPVYKLNNTLAAQGVSATLPTVDLITRGDKKILEVSGAAVLKKDKLIGFLNEDETKYLLFIKNRIKTPLLIEKVSADNKSPQNPNVSLEVFRNKTQITPQYVGGKVVINIKTNTEAAVSEVYNGVDFGDDSNRNNLITQSEKHLESDIINLIKRVQNDYGVDIFEFSSIIKSEKPSLWRTLESDWDRVFKNLDVKVDSQINIRNQGKQGKPINIGG